MLRRPYGAACDVWGARHDPRRVPARPPQAQNDRPHFGDFECSGRPREVEWAGPRPCTSLHMSPRSLHRACMAWGRRGGRGHGTRGGQKCQNDQKSERVTDGSRGENGIAMWKNSNFFLSFSGHSDFERQQTILAIAKMPPTLSPLVLAENRS